MAPITSTCKNVDEMGDEVLRVLVQVMAIIIPVTEYHQLSVVLNTILITTLLRLINKEHGWSMSSH